MVKIKIKKWIYTLCFICIMMIDWVKNTQSGAVWIPIVNLTGVVMGVLMLSHFNWKKRTMRSHLIWLCVWLVGTAIGYFGWMQYELRIIQTQYMTASLSVGGLGTVLLCIWQDRKQMVKFQKKDLCLLGLLGVLSVIMLVSRRHELWPLWYFVMFGAFYFIPFSKQEKKDMWDAMANGVIVGFFILQIFAYGFRPYDEVRYVGAFENCNMNALMYTVTYAMLLYKLHDLLWAGSEPESGRGGRKKWLPAAFYFVLAAGVVDFILFTMTRTAILSVGLLTLLFLLYEAVLIRKVKFVRLFAVCVSSLLCVLLLFPCVYLTIRYLPTVMHHPIWWGAEYSPDKVHSFDPYDSAKYVSLEEFCEAAFGRLYYTIFLPPEALIPIEHTVAAVAQLTAVPDTIEISNVTKAQDSYTYRKVIYEQYFSNLNWVGHTSEEGEFPITSNYYSRHAHNIFLQVSFFHGIPAGVCLVVLLAALGLRLFRLAVSSRQKQSILALFVWLIFVSYGMLESVWFLGQSILFLMYFVPKLLVDAKESETGE